MLNLHSDSKLTMTQENKDILLLLAPTAINQQKFSFALHDGNTMEARTRFTTLNGYAPIDLGIAKCHFEIGAGIENFEWQ